MSEASAPYPGLRPYREDEQDKFFGRETDKSILMDKVLGNRLTLLFAASGVGKSSLLNAAVIPQLKAEDGEHLAVVYYNDWVRDTRSTPLQRLQAAILASLRQAGHLPESAQPDLINEASAEAFSEFLGFCSLFTRAPLILVLDQFEEFFRYQRHTPHFYIVIDALTAVITDEHLPISVVFSMREDFAMELNAFKPQLPTLLFENFYRLEKLQRPAAVQAILDPARQVGCDYEPALLEKLLDDLEEHQRVGLGLPHEEADIKSTSTAAIDPPYLQIVCAYLWRLKQPEVTVLQLADYRQAKGVDGILNYFLHEALDSLSHAEKKLASRAFDFLAAQRGVKMAYPLDVLARIVRVKPQALERVLNKLARRNMNILRDQVRGEVLWYELYHDMFSEHIERWNTAWKAQQHRRRQRILGSLLLVLVLVLAVLLDSLWWLSNNSHFPVQYLFKQQEFRLMHWGLLPEPLPKMVQIPAAQGEFLVGELDADFGERYNAYLKSRNVYSRQNFGYPPMNVTIPASFAIGQYEITYEQYDYYVWQQRRAGRMPDALDYPTGATRDSARGMRAVTQVSWDEAMAYTQWLTDKTGDSYRLPTEVEWEYAARAGSDTAYPWGNEVGRNQANCDGCGSDWDNQLVAPVGSFTANAWGLYDTSGNVWEWTCSLWASELSQEATRCAGEGAETLRVIRGGSWSNSPDWVRSSARYWNFAGLRFGSVGFRVVRFPPQDN